MATVNTRPTTPGRRHEVKNDYSELTQGNKPVKSLVKSKKQRAGRNSAGKITVRHRGGGNRRHYRLVDFKRDKREIPATVASIEYDPNRSAHIALLHYADGEKRYILAPVGLETGQTIMAGAEVDPKPGNALPLKNIPAGVPIHNIELTPGKGGQMVRGAGVAATIQAKEGDYVTILLPSKEVRLVNAKAYATVGQVSNVVHKTVKLGKAGKKRHRGFRPTVRGVAMHPGAHPHGGGEGRSGVGMAYPKSPTGKHALGKKTRKKNKYSNRFIIKDRRKRK